MTYFGVPLSKMLDRERVVEISVAGRRGEEVEEEEEKRTEGREEDDSRVRGRKCHYANKCKMKKKINNLDISEELKDSLEKLFLESDDSEDITSASEIDHISDSSQDSEENMCPCKQEHQKMIIIN
ncbi:hypothetical protein M9H77_23844 [Catharanthus roseus]|uniref:Uncharacterized protein n=1 Tax=Catharanthus roseus TaxID=4058 RepID=A0ACC0AV82_CATRO|nr:hypothetical protein M9H77_23844 [Catharanthus roseus]